MPDLTAHDLYELVKGLPEEARPMSPREPRVGSQPDGAVYYESAAWWMVWDVRERTIPIAAAILLHEASVMRWLIEKGWYPMVGQRRSGEFVAVDGSLQENHQTEATGPTLLHALVAAAEGVG